VEGFLRLSPTDALAPGGELSFKVLGRRILIRRGDDGGLVALELACRHQNADLTGAARAGSILTCSRHGWRYDLRDGACIDQPWAALRRFAVIEKDGAIWIATRPAPDSTL
jgi:nitrite reductase/ring-hydroxylating ferredoxin subunit